jgi:chromate reductase, NAD(P)H dehydrogenase (quinone)
MDTLNILIIPGSARAGSLNRKLATFAAHRACAAGYLVNELDLRALALPLYDGDLEASAGIPEGALQLLEAVVRCDAVLIVTPEYNGFPTPLVINAFDWLSRIMPTPTEPSGLAATANKPVGLLSASPGPGGALRSMNFLRQYLQMAFAMIVVPQQFALGKAHEAFDDAGGLKDVKAGKSVEGVLNALSTLALALKARNQV